ncbi:hypothetical protein [Nitratidesulfovibrio termitidis]|uniref:hypothetical protein n=1 Tax=Nitratidesulfovibrio termitidis TaxID=42252 RepID=UPI00041332F6|nr:hypothetical protein [Nitratidesulfovibrio termitidis]
MNNGKVLVKGTMDNAAIGENIRKAVELVVSQYADKADGFVLHLMFETQAENGATAMNGVGLAWGDLDLAMQTQLFGRTLAMAEREIIPGATSATAQ